MTHNAHKFQGLSGRWYQFEMCDLPAATKPACGVYLFGRSRSDGLYDVLYIGRASVLKNRVKDNHEKFGPARSMGMTTLGQLACGSEQLADLIERDSISMFAPPLNDNLKST